MKTITTNSGGIALYENGYLIRTFPKGTLMTIPLPNTSNPNRLMITLVGTALKWDLGSDTTIDGESFDSIEELAQKISSFSRGGGDGDGVTQEQLDERAPELPVNYFMVGGAGGNEGREILTSDFSGGSNGTRALTRDPDGSWVWRPLSSAPISNSFVYRGTSGTAKAQNAVASDDLVALNQFQGIINDDLTATQTSAELNALYPNIAIGSIVRTQTNATAYQKFTVDTWESWDMVIV